MDTVLAAQQEFKVIFDSKFDINNILVYDLNSVY